MAKGIFFYGEGMDRKDVKNIMNAGVDEPYFVDALEMEEYEHELVRDAHKIFLKLCEANYADGLQKGRNFLFVERQHREKDDPDRTSYRTRVRFRYGTTVQAEWYVRKIIKHEYKDSSGKHTKEWFLRNTEPKKKLNGDYTDKMFKQSPDWVQVCGEQVEGAYRIIRRRNAVLSEIRDKLYELDRLNRKLFDMDCFSEEQKARRPKPINQSYVQNLVAELETEN